MASRGRMQKQMRDPFTKQDSSSLSAIPPQILVEQIFVHLEGKDLLKSSLVNVKWYQLIKDPKNDPIIWKSACLKKWGMESNEPVELAVSSWSLAWKSTTRDQMKEVIRVLSATTEYNEFFLVHRNVTALPSVLFSYLHLQKISFFGNPIETLPVELCKLTNLEHLYLYYNRLKELPKEISQLKKLHTLGLSHNQLTSLPDELSLLTNLVRLEFDHNQLSSLPVKQLACLTNLETLYISRNPISCLPSQLTALRNSNLKQLRDCDY